MLTLFLSSRRTRRLVRGWGRFATFDARKPAIANVAVCSDDTLQLLFRSIARSFAHSARVVGVKNLSQRISLLLYLVLGCAEWEVEELIAFHALRANRLPIGLATCRRGRVPGESASAAVVDVRAQ